jgi:hypothetical protein
VWAAGSAPIIVCEDARLDGNAEAVDSAYGQAGWDWGINYGSSSRQDNFQHLIEILQGPIPDHICGKWWASCEPLGDGELAELALNCHGYLGEFDIDAHAAGQNLVMGAGEARAGTTMKADTVSAWGAQFAVLDKLLAPDHGVLFFMGCLVGRGITGDDLLMAVSKVLPGRDIMAITTMGVSTRQTRSGAHGKSEPGMRDTPYGGPADSEKDDDARYPFAKLDDLSATGLPWASRMSPHTKVARDGRIVHAPVDEGGT